MAHQVLWTPAIIEEFTNLAGLNEDEVKICNGLMRRDTATVISKSIHKSEDRIYHIVERLKVKYDNVQPMAKIMPPRKKSSKELYK